MQLRWHLAHIMSASGNKLVVTKMQMMFLAMSCQCVALLLPLLPRNVDIGLITPLSPPEKVQKVFWPPKKTFTEIFWKVYC